MNLFASGEFYYVEVQALELPVSDCFASAGRSWVRIGLGLVSLTVGYRFLRAAHKPAHTKPKQAVIAKRRHHSTPARRTA